MRQLMLAIVLILVPVGLFAVGYRYLSPPPPTQVSLGDLSAFKIIVTDVQGIAATGDLAAAETRVTDFEDMWDQAEDTMRPLNPGAWGQVDDAADAVFSALRRGTPDAAKVTAALAALQVALDDPTAGLSEATGPIVVAGITISDESGHPLSCEDMLTKLRDALATTKVTGIDLQSAQDFQSRALERCNADDDRHADEFTAQALALLAAQN
ncbi:MAG: hypothetical protein NTX73_11150 [Rhodobacterales bacterium]|nr:hypothetical protein [Rhodobacterales bacterium]